MAAGLIVGVIGLATATQGHVDQFGVAAAIVFMSLGLGLAADSVKRAARYVRDCHRPTAETAPRLPARPEHTEGRTSEP